jgi:hypothetical protein|tara:strand:+ start:1471 stop:1623 length:153 start_codon:yes stop_codon:yes gene_type:complete
VVIEYYVVVEFGKRHMFTTYKEAYEMQQQSKDPFCGIGFIYDSWDYGKKL